MEPDSLIGQRVFGGYVVKESIGSGGMGQVYLVENRELQRKLVIKVLLPERTSNRELVERFLAEARAASAISHRHIVEILDSSTLADGRPYILMEYLEGETLFAFAHARMPLPMDVTLAILCQVCSGLEAAHKRGVIHRDIKPSNIFIAPQPDNRYFTKVLDFGIAKLEDPQLAGGVMTRSIMVAGTPHYMSPEQARTLRDVDHRTDIYAVGVIAYELLTGKVPYDAHSIGELVFQQARSTPKALSHWRPDLPQQWSDVLEQAMSLEPSERPSSAKELAMLMIAATPDGTRIAKDVAPLLFARGDRVASVVGVPMSEIEAQVSEVRSDPPRSRHGASRSSSSGMDTSARRPSSLGRQTALLDSNRAPSRAGSHADPTNRMASMREASLVFGLPPPIPEDASIPPSAPPSVPPSAPPSAVPSTPPSDALSTPPSAPQVTGIEAEERSRNLRWLLIVMVLVAAIGAAIAIGLFTGPQRLGGRSDGLDDPPSKRVLPASGSDVERSGP